MANKKIVIDIYGSDEGPLSVVKGTILLLNAHSEVDVILVGDENLIVPILDEANIAKDRYKIIHTTEAITNADNIMEAFFNKPKASVILAIQELANNDETIGMLSPGNSGAIIVGSIKYLSTPEFTRPCIAAVLPVGANNKFTCLVDTGSTNDCQASQLHQFARLGSDLIRKLYKINSPKVALLCNGTEDTKGNKLTKETFKILKEDSTINFVGNIEANSVMGGDIDVLVTDGFDGNIFLKTIEGSFAKVIKDIFVYAKKNNSEDAMKIGKSLLSTYDISAIGGGIVLGARKFIIKCRGNSREITYLNTGEMLLRIDNDEDLYNLQNN